MFLFSISILTIEKERACTLQDNLNIMGIISMISPIRFKAENNSSILLKVISSLYRCPYLHMRPVTEEDRDQYLSVVMTNSQVWDPKTLDSEISKDSNGWVNPDDINTIGFFTIHLIKHQKHGIHEKHMLGLAGTYIQHKVRSIIHCSNITEEFLTVIMYLFLMIMSSLTVYIPKKRSTKV